MPRPRRSIADEFVVVTAQLDVIAHVALALDPDDLAFVSRELALAADFGPFTDPTKWRDHRADREALSELAAATTRFRAAAAAFRDAVHRIAEARRG